MNYQEENADIVGKREFSSVLKKAWIRGIQKDAVISGFRAAGLYPWNPEHVNMSKLGPSRLYATTTDTETNSDTMTETDSDRVAEPTRTETDSGLVTEFTRTETDSDTVTEQLEKTGLVPGCEIVTLTAADETRDDEPKGLPVRPPSPAPILSALPPTAGCSSYSKSQYHLYSSILFGRTYVRNVSDFSTRESLDRLLDLAAKVGFDGLVCFQSLHALKI